MVGPLSSGLGTCDKEPPSARHQERGEGTSSTMIPLPLNCADFQELCAEGGKIPKMARGFRRKRLAARGKRFWSFSKILVGNDAIWGANTED
jgi:hypothetical protein